MRLETAIVERRERDARPAEHEDPARRPFAGARLAAALVVVAAWGALVYA